MKVSAFVLTTNSIENQFPFIESIKSFLPIVDELIVVDGGSTDSTIEAINNIGDNKIRIISDENTKWEKEWFYSRMGKNFDRGLQECTGDWVIKFDADYILHENCYDKIRDELEKAIKNTRLSIAFTRLNFILSDRYYIKSKKTLAINKTLALDTKINLHYGFDLDNWGFGFEFINSKYVENNIHIGKLLRDRNNSVVTSALVYNYDFCFSDLDNIKNSRYRHHLAEEKQRHLKYEGYEIQKYHNKIEDVNIENVWDEYRERNIGFLNNTNYGIELEEHPLIIQNKIKKLTSDKQGYNFFGLSGNKSKYYE